MAVNYYEGVGRRKASTARVRLMNGSGQILINDKPMDEYFTRLGDKESVLSPLIATEQNIDSLDISVHVVGGGVTGQSNAVKLGVARALIKMNPDLRSTIRKGGFLTRDPRVKERKKPGLKRARKAPTYTKR